MVKKVVIVGAGASGLLLAHYLLQRGDKYQVEIYELRDNPLVLPFSKSRTFPIALNQRGMSAVNRIEGLETALKACSVELKGTVPHKARGNQRVVKRKKPLIVVNRKELTVVLLEQLVKKFDDSRLKIHFNCQCTQVNFAKKQAQFQGKDKLFNVDYDLLVGADGVNSIVREQMLSTESFTCEQTIYQNQYKSLFLPSPDENYKSKFRVGEFHTWRIDDGTSILLLYQADETMAGVIYFPTNKNKVANLTSTQEVMQFFVENFPQVAALMPKEEAEAFSLRPVSSIKTIRCNRYHYGDSTLIIGDAGHAIAPSFGQGCNAALEDAFILNNLLDEYSDNLALVLEQFSLRRKDDADAIAFISEVGFPSSKKLLLQFIIRERFQQILHSIFPQSYKPSMMDMLAESTISYAEIFNLNKAWISKVKKANKQFMG
jgi:kynurenine 3-monooxygenase